MEAQPQPAAHEQIESTPLAAIATAPGDMSLASLQMRAAARERQFRHDNTISPLAPAPGQVVEVEAISGTGVPLASAAVFYTVDGSAPGQHTQCVAMTAAGADWDALGGFLRQWRATIPAQPEGTIVRYRVGGWREAMSHAADAAPDVWAQDGQGFWYKFPAERGITTFAYRAEQYRPPLPEWVRDAVIYQIFLDRFHPGTPDGAFHHAAGPREIHGGTFRGVSMSLPHLAALGVTCLWLSPIWPAESYHRYDVMDLFHVDPTLGTEQDLRDLIGAAHGLGMRVILDFVPSHASWHHPAFLAAQAAGDAPTSNWFTFDRRPDQYRCFLDLVPKLPSWNLEDPGARAHVIDSAVYWIREFGVDGYRLDHAIAPSMDFWVAFRAATQAANPECFSVGEATDSPDCLRRYRNRLDGVLDFKLAGALRLTFGTGDWRVSKLDSFLHAYDQYMAAGPGRVSFLDNHDMDRFLWVARNDVSRLKLAALCQFTLAPTPTIYYGTEIGIRQPFDSAESSLGGDAAERTDMPWNRAVWDGDVLRFYTELIALRRTYPAARAGYRHTVWIDDDTQTLAYLCSETEQPVAGSSMLVAFNLSAEQRTIAIATDAVAGRGILSTGAEPISQAGGCAGAHGAAAALGGRHDSRVDGLHTAGGAPARHTRSGILRDSGLDPARLVFDAPEAEACAAPGPFHRDLRDNLRVCRRSNAGDGLCHARCCPAADHHHPAGRREMGT